MCFPIPCTTGYLPVIKLLVSRLSFLLYLCFSLLIFYFYLRPIVPLHSWCTYFCHVSWVDTSLHLVILLKGVSTKLFCLYLSDNALINIFILWIKSITYLLVDVLAMLGLQSPPLMFYISDILILMSWKFHGSCDILVIMAWNFKS